MINREMIKAILLSYEDNPDEYGQVKQNTPNKRTIEITKPKLYKHTNVEDIRFKENIDKYGGVGTAEFANKAISIYCNNKTE